MRITSSVSDMTTNMLKKHEWCSGSENVTLLPIMCITRLLHLNQVQFCLPIRQLWIRDSRVCCCSQLYLVEQVATLVQWRKKSRHGMAWSQEKRLEPNCPHQSPWWKRSCPSVGQKICEIVLLAQHFLKPTIFPEASWACLSVKHMNHRERVWLD